MLPLACALLASLPLKAHACWTEAATRYGLAPELLVAVARVESNLDPTAVNRSHRARTGTVDIGLMQVNSSHLKTLASFGIEQAQLADPCTNIHVGAWLLADAFARHGAGWNAIGAYNAACTRLKGEACAAARARYAWQVYRRLRERAGLPAAMAPVAAGRDTTTRATPAPPVMAVRVTR